MVPAVGNPSNPTAGAAELLCMMDWAAHFRDHSTLQALARTSNDAGLSIQSDSVLFKRLLLAGLDEASGIAKVEEDFESVLSILTEAEDWLLSGVPGHDLFDLKLKIRRQLVLSPLRNSLPDDLDSVSTRSLAALNNERYWYLLDKIFPLETSRRASLSGSDAGGWVSPGARHEGGYRKVVEIKERKQLLDVMRGDGSPLDGDNMDMNKVLYLLKTYSKAGFLAEVGHFTRRAESKLLPDPEPFKEGGEVGNGRGGRGGGGVASSLLGRDPRTVLSAAGRARERLQNWSRASGLVGTEAEREATESKIRKHVHMLRHAVTAGGVSGGRRSGGRRTEQEEEQEKKEEEAESEEESESEIDARRLASNLRTSTRMLQKGLRERGLLNVRGNVGSGRGGGGGGGVGGGTTNKKKRLYDPARKGRLITFEDSQYAGSESSDGEEEEEDNVAASESRRRAVALQRRTQEAAAAAAARLADRDKKSQRGKPAALPPAAVSGKRCRDVGEEAEEGEVVGGGDEEQQEEIHSTTESSSSSSSGSEDEDDERERVRALKRGGGRRVMAAKRKARLQVQPYGRSKRRQPKTHRSFWSSDEVADLKQAVLHDGMKGRWADILNSPKYLHLDFKLRTSVDLKDKWRGLERKAAAKGVTVDEVN